LLTWLRKQESINAFNLIIKLLQQNRVSEYYISATEILEHFRFLELFLRHTKKVYISIVGSELISEIERSSEVSYSAIRKRLAKTNRIFALKSLEVILLPIYVNIESWQNT